MDKDSIRSGKGVELEDNRSELRIEVPFEAKVRGIDAEVNTFKSVSALDNLSSRGLYLRLPSNVKEGSKLLVIISFSPDGHIAARGEVLRVEPQPDGKYGVALKFTQHRFL